MLLRSLWVIAGLALAAPSVGAQGRSCDATTVVAIRKHTDAVRKRHVSPATTHNRGTNASLASVDSTIASVCLGPVTPPNQKPVAAFTHTCPTTPTTALGNYRCTFTSTSADPDGTIAATLWTWPAGPTSTTATVVRGLAAGQHVVRLEVTDNSGAKDTAMQAITVGSTAAPPPVNRPPVAIIAFACTPTTPDFVCAFNGAGSSDPDGTIQAYLWNVSGCLGTLNSVAVACTLAAGTYQASLSVTDDKGLTSVATQSVTVGGAPPPPPPPPPTTVAFARLGVAEVPRIRLNPATVRPSSFARTIVASTCAAFQAAIDTSRPGDLIELATVPQCPSPVLSKRAHPPGAVTVIRPAGTAHTLGLRARPSLMANRPKLYAPANMTHALSTQCGARDFWVEGFEIAPAPGINDIHTLIPLGNATACDSTVQNIHLVGNWIHGNPGARAVRGIALNSWGGAIIEDNWCEEFHAVNEDSQCIGSWNGSGPYRINNNYLAAAGETIMFGGAQPSILNNVPSDVELCGNHFDRPLGWKTLGYTVKAIFELKTVRRLYGCNNVFERTWGQSALSPLAAFNGMNWTFKSANQPPNATTPGNCRACSTSDVTMVDNLVRNVAGLLSIAGATQGPLDSTTRRITIVNTLLEEEVGTADYNFSTGQRHDVLFIQGAVDGLELVNFRACDFASGAAMSAGMTLGTQPVTGFVVRRGCIKPGRYGALFGNGEGSPTLTMWAPNAVWDSVAVVGSITLSKYPPTTFLNPSPTFGVDPVALKSKLAGVVVPR